MGITIINKHSQQGCCVPEAMSGRDAAALFSGIKTAITGERAAREGRNPQSGEPMTIAASKAPKFKAGKALKDMINN